MTEEIRKMIKEMDEARAEITALGRNLQALGADISAIQKANEVFDRVTTEMRFMMNENNG